MNIPGLLRKSDELRIRDLEAELESAWDKIYKLKECVDIDQFPNIDDIINNPTIKEDK